MSLALSLTLARPQQQSGGSPAPAFDPADLFASSENGLYFNAEDGSTLFTDAGKLSAANSGDDVYTLEDQSGNGNDAVQATATRRPKRTGIPSALGAQMVTAPFDLSDPSWTLVNWNTDGTKTSSSAATASAALGGLVAGQTYLVFTSFTRTAGNVGVRFTGGTTVTGGTFNEANSHTELFVAESGNTTIEVFGDAAYRGEIQGVRVFPVTAFACEGLQLNGIDNFIQTAAVDFSGTQQRTTVAKFWRDSRGGARVVWEVGQYGAAAQSGSHRRIYGSTGDFQARDATVNGVGITADPGPLTSFEEPRLTTEFWEEDYSQVAHADQFDLYKEGVLNNETTAGSGPLSLSGLSNGFVTLGAANNGAFDCRLILSQFLTIDRILTAQERADLLSVMSGPKCALLGDSTTASNKITSGQPSQTWTTSAFVGGAEFGQFDFSAPGDKILDQKTLWQNSTADKSALQYVFLQVGLNDINTFVGNGTKTAAQILADIQGLVDTVRADVSASCKIVVCELTPCRAWLEDGASTPANMYPAWQDVNEGIRGEGANAITGVDGVVSSHVAALDDGSGNLASEFDHNGDGVHPDNYGRWINAQAYRTFMVADGAFA